MGRGIKNEKSIAGITRKEAESRMAIIQKL